MPGWKQFYFIIFVLFLVSAGHAAINNDSGAATSWGYKGNLGPIYWPQLNPSFALCGTGKTQSPIDIPKRTKKIKIDLAFHYQPAPLVIIEDGLTELLIDHQPTLYKDGHSVQINFPSNETREFITLQGKNYRLVQFHFHSPSENIWHHQTFPLEIHFVHQGDDGKVVVVGVFVKGGSENIALQKIISHLPNQAERVHFVKETKISPANLLPKSISYYQFLGSLTTPPCTEGISWVVMAEAITASPRQITALRKAMGGSNARPVQPLNARAVHFADIAALNIKQNIQSV